MSSPEFNRAANRHVARAIPVVLLAAFAYGSWAFTKALCVDYLLNIPTSEHRPKRTHIAIALLTIYYFLLIVTIASYIRLLQVVSTRPGLIPRGMEWSSPKDQSKNGVYDEIRHKREGSNASPRSKSTRSSTRRSSSSRHVSCLTGAEEVATQMFWQRDIYVCKDDGLPVWCSDCLNWKSDRGHHCSELQRCVHKMDHFCPWVGGIVGETSYKFFVQFLFYASAYCIFTLTCFAVYLARAGTNGFWISGIGLAGFFGLFACGMTLSSLQMAFQNLTTIENLGRNTKVWVLAALIPKINRFTSTTNTAMDVQSPKPSMPSYAFPFPTITFEVGKGTSPPPVYHQPNTSFTIQPATRTFAILSLEAGRNPFDLGPWGNIQQIMGYTFLEWLLPIRYSPCADHSSPESAYAMSPEIRKMRLSLGPD